MLLLGKLLFSVEPAAGFEQRLGKETHRDLHGETQEEVQGEPIHSHW